MTPLYEVLNKAIEDGYTIPRNISSGVLLMYVDDQMTQVEEDALTQWLKKRGRSEETNESVITQVGSTGEADAAARPLSNTKNGINCHKLQPNRDIPDTRQIYIQGERHTFLWAGSSRYSCAPRYS